jgi:hypothetical protein
MEQVNETVSDEQQLVELGIVLGQRKAFGMVAGRCSAAQAECLRKIHDEKLYLRFSPSWAQYCESHLKVSRRTADRAIALLKELGTIYYEAAALTGITPAEFRRVRDAIREDGIHIGGAVIALIPQNSERAVEAIAQLQAAAEAAEPKPGPSTQMQIRDLEKRGKQLCQSFHDIAQVADCIERQWLVGTIKKVQSLFNRLEGEIT